LEKVETGKKEGNLPNINTRNNNYLKYIFFYPEEPGYRSQYSDRLWAGQPRGWSSSPGKVKNFLFSKSSRLALGSTQPSIKWVPGALFPGNKAAGAWSWPLTSN
jgi:hypothetical protein